VGEEVALGEVLFRVHSERSGLTRQAAASDLRAANSATELPMFSRKALQLLSQLRLDPAAFSGATMVTEEDVRKKALEAGNTMVSATAAQQPAPVGGAEIEGDRIPLDRAKRVENRQLVAANHAALKSTVFHFCPGAVPPFPVILDETVQLLTKFQHLNAYCLDDAAFVYRHVHAGFAVDLGRGLKMLVIRNAETLSFAEITARFEELLLKYTSDNLSVATSPGPRLQSRICPKRGSSLSRHC
jgi:2-oxoglutarate dehydrogenase E2 component (dihydrolipoamide succinyltransferase)